MKRGFTLLEIMVAMAIAALAAAIIIPSYGIVRARAGSATCLANLKSLGTALNVYLQDHQMIMPVMEAGRTDRTENVPVIDNTLDKYVDDRRVFICPAGRAIAEKSGTSYYWNSLLSKGGGTTENPEPLSALNLNFFGATDLGRIPVMIDKEGWHKHTEDKVNHLFADGHVSNNLRLFSE
jgi:prepilin-type N-terminal cleavage/methylation domain-containing protein/prepilin-type processing-associated H-X9-DG protein